MAVEEATAVVEAAAKLHSHHQRQRGSVSSGSAAYR